MSEGLARREFERRVRQARRQEHGPTRAGRPQLSALSANVPETLTTPRITEQGERATDHEQHFFFFPFLSLV